MARIFYDCEFIEDGTTIDLVSVGAVDESGQHEFYAISRGYDGSKAGRWVQEHVLDKIRFDDPAHRSRLQLREDFYAFLMAFHTRDDPLELWAWNAPYDHVVIAQLWGAMPALPRELPRFTRDLRQRWEDVGRPALPPAPADAHNALADARHNLVKWRTIDEIWRARMGEGASGP